MKKCRNDKIQKKGKKSVVTGNVALFKKVTRWRKKKKKKGWKISEKTDIGVCLEFYYIHPTLAATSISASGAHEDFDILGLFMAPTAAYCPTFHLTESARNKERDKYDVSQWVWQARI